MQKVIAALKVIVLTKETVEYLMKNDPQALKQAVEALWSCGDLTEGNERFILDIASEPLLKVGYVPRYQKR